MDNVNLPLGLRVQTQIPLDVKTYSPNEATLSNLGVNDNLAYTYVEGLIVYCVEEKSRWEWREAGILETGLRPTNFTYPNNIIAFGIDYSNRSFNFFSVAEALTSDSAFQQGLFQSAFVRGRDSNNYGSLGSFANDLSHSNDPLGVNGASANYSTISGGLNHKIGQNADYAVISGGQFNEVNSQNSGILSGVNNSITLGARNSVICSGAGNVINDFGNHFYKVIVGGQENRVDALRSTIVNGLFNAINVGGDRSIIGTGESNVINSAQSGIFCGYTNTTDGLQSIIGGGSLNQTKGDGSSILGGYGNISDSYAEVALGMYGTTYTPVSRINFSTLDRILNVGVGLNDGIRRDALSVFKNGLAFLPTVTNSLIAAASGKAIITKEYFEANLIETDPTAIHKTGNESGLTGIKTWTNTGATQINGLSLINNGTNGSYSLSILNTLDGKGINIVNNGGYGQYISNTSSGYGLGMNNDSSGGGILIDNMSTGLGIVVSNNAAGRGIYVDNVTSGVGIEVFTNSSGKGINVNATPSSTAFSYTGQNNGTNTFTVSKTGAIVVSDNFLAIGTNKQIMVANNGGSGIRLGACGTIDAFLGGSVVGDGVVLAHQKLFLAVGAGAIPVSYTETGNLGVGVINPTTKVDIAPSTTTAASLRFRQGVAPTSPLDGDMWLEDNSLTGLKIRINGVTRTVTLT